MQKRLLPSASFRALGRSCQGPCSSGPARHQQEPSGAKPPDSDNLTATAALGEAQMLQRPHRLRVVVKAANLHITPVYRPRVEGRGGGERSL